MKIIAVLNNSVGSGGGVDQALNAIIQMKSICREKFIFEVFVTQKSNAEFLRQLSIKVTLIRITFIDRFLAKFSQNVIWQSIQLRLKILGPLEKKLISRGCDLVYFVAPGELCGALQKLNYINTLWDLCHRESPEFPEVRSFNNFFIRENNYKNNLGLALLNITDSENLSALAAKIYGVDRARFLAVPFSPTPYFEDRFASNEKVVFKKYDMQEGYFYYPSQFWPHKNHIRILQALVILREQHKWMPKVVFSGKDYGNLDYILNQIKEKNLGSQIKVLGFVPAEDLKVLYKKSLAIVMPTYFGPTNLPPIEAWMLDKPLIYSSHLINQAQDAAILINPDDASDLAKAMFSCRDSEVVERLIENGRKRIKTIDADRLISEKKLTVILENFSLRRDCWGKN